MNLVMLKFVHLSKVFNMDKILIVTEYTRVSLD